MENMLSWEDTYALAHRLMERFPNISLSAVSLDMIYHWVIELPDFSDDFELANDEILRAIYQEWYEEANPL